MPVDLEYLRQHYASLSDDALLSIDRADLVAAAQNCYDEEIARRNLGPQRPVARVEPRRASPAIQEPVEEEAEADHESPGDGEKPDWLDEAAEIYSRVDTPGTAASL